MNIGGFEIGKEKSFIIAELSANHNGSIHNALATIEAAKRAGADAIKFQTYTADTLTIKSDKPDFLLKHGTIWDGMYLHDLYKEAYTPWEWHAELMEKAKTEGLICFSTPFDFTAVDFLEVLDVPAYKIASFEITDVPLIKYAASKGKPMIISTGIATYEDIKEAIEACRSVGNNDIIILQCTSSYPAPLEIANLVMVKELAETFNVVTGLSDHTLGNTAPVVAVTLGAAVIEKHFIIDRSIGGPDASFSLNEQEFAEMVRAVRDAEKSKGKAAFKTDPISIKGREFSRSLYIVENVKKGDRVTRSNIRSIRPGFAMHPKHLFEVLDQKFTADFEKGTRLDWNCIESEKKEK
jgi:pseudaminic acid synthase